MEIPQMNKKGVLDDLSNLVKFGASFVILMVVVFLILAQSKTQVQSIDGVNASGQNAAGVETSASFNATRTVQEAVSTIPSWLKIIVITVIGGILLGLVQYFRTK